MDEISLKAILVLDEKTQRHRLAGHNLSADMALERASQLRDKGLFVLVLDQTIRHRGHGYKNCKLCQNAAENVSPHPPQDPAEKATAENATETCEQESSPHFVKE